jgi:hypothetical protein
MEIEKMDDNQIREYVMIVIVGNDALESAALIAVFERGVVTGNAGIDVTVVMGMVGTAVETAACRLQNYYLSLLSRGKKGRR